MPNDFRKHESIRCGRIDEHPGHYWNCPVVNHGHLKRIQYWCPGRVTIEGGSLSGQGFAND